MNNIDFSAFGYKPKEDKKKTPKSQFYKDLKVANVTEKEIAKIIEDKFSCKAVEFRDDNKYDIKFQEAGAEFTVEVKEDFTCKKTGNIGVEYSCRGKDSGISVSEADYYCFKAHVPNGSNEVLLMRTVDLKQLISEEAYHRKVNGGDVGSNSLNYLFKLSDIQGISQKLS